MGANLAAAYVAAGRSADLPKAAAALKLAPRAGFEVAYNFGCALLAQSDLEAARQQLLHAQRLGEHLPAMVLGARSCSTCSAGMPLGILSVPAVFDALGHGPVWQPAGRSQGKLAGAVAAVTL